MSIGEYYKILMEGKRPTRQRTTKEEVKTPTPQPARGPQISPGSIIPGSSVSPNAAAGVSRKEAFGRSHSEHGAIQGGGAAGGKISTEKSQFHQGAAKRKIKLKHKRGHFGASPNQRQRSVEERKQNSPALLQQHLQQKPQLIGSSGMTIGGHISVLKSSLTLQPTEQPEQETPANSAIAKLRHRDHSQRRPSFNRPKRKKERKEEDEEVKGKKHEEARKALQMGQKFEMIEVHPLYGACRFATAINSKSKDGIYTFQRVFKIDKDPSDEYKFNVALGNSSSNNVEEIKESDLKQVDFDEVYFASRVFIASLALIEKTSEVQKRLVPLFKHFEVKSLKLDDLQSTADDPRNILLIQLVSNTPQELPHFAALLPSEKSIQAMEISLKDPTQILKSLNDLDDNETAYETFINDNQNHFAEKRKGSPFEILLRNAQELNKAYTNYENATSTILITKENLEDTMYTQIHYTSSEQQAPQVNQTQSEKDEQLRQKQYKQGVFLRAKLDKTYYHEHILFIKKLGSQQNKTSKATAVHKESRSEWLQLSKFRITSDISKGYISLECLSSVNSDGSNRLKKRNIKYIGFRESLKQRKSLKHISNESFDCPESEEPRKATLYSDSTDRPGDRCVICNYQAHGYQHLRCSHCLKVFHQECVKLDQKRLHQLYLGTRECEWRCPDCVRCVNCLSTGGKSQAQQLLICKCCNAAYHYECMDPSVKMSMPNIIQEPTNKAAQTVISTASELEFNCERCVQCEQCGSREAGKSRLHKWSKDFKLCSNCNKKRKKKQFCAVCDTFWPDEQQQIQTQIQGNAQSGEDVAMAQATIPNAQLLEYLQNNMITCRSCNMTVHYSCDRIFDDEETLKRFKSQLQRESSINSFGGEPLQYHCQDCRQAQRSLLIKQLIDRLANEDRFYFFQDPVEEQIRDYTKFIKTPMCFAYVKQRATSNQYLNDPSILKRDIQLIFENAMKYNLPKHKVHKEAARLIDICTAVLDSVWSRLERNAQMTQDENLHKEWLKRERVITLAKSLKEQGLKILRSKSVEEQENQKPQYKLSLEESYDPSEFQPQQQTALRTQEQLQDSPDQLGASDIAIDDDEDADISQTVDNDDSTAQAAKRRKLRTAKRQINYNEDRLAGELGVGIKRPWAGEEGNRGVSSKRARFNQQQQAHSSQFSLSSFKGANLLQQAMHQQQQQEMLPHYSAPQHAVGDSHQSSVTFGAPHNSADTTPQDLVVNRLQQHQQMMISYYQEIDDERCYYSNPARCSFDDPLLVFSEMCYLCGSFGKKEDFLSCTLCGESFHTYCLQIAPQNENDDNEVDDREIIAKFQPYWKCLNCKFCELCSSATQEAYLLYCDVCDKAFHSFCLTPALKSIPKCQWKCQECFKCQSCGTRSFFDSEKHLKPGTNQLIDSIASQTDFEFSQNFSLCYECGLNEHKKSFCKICQQSNNKSSQKESGENDGPIRKSRHQQQQHDLQSLAHPTGGEKMLKCKQCGFYCHVMCSRLLPQMDESCDEDEEPENFKCLECLLTGKSINHLIRETCEHYENMHQILARQRLLAQLLSEMLTSYFPMPDKAPVFIKAFIDSNQDFFKYDAVVNDWLSLLETGVAFNSEQEESTNISTNQQVAVVPQTETKDNVTADGDQKMTDETQSNQVQQVEESKQQEEQKMKVPIVEIKSPKPEWKNIDLQEAYNLETPSKPEVKTPAEIAYEKMYAHKESFLPPKRDLYDALASDEGDHRFGQRKHFIDPFATETQALITLPTEENLSQIDFAQMYVEYELKAVMKIKLKFFAWFEDMVRMVIERNEKRMEKKKEQKAVTEPSLEEVPSHEIASFIAHEHPSHSHLDHVTSIPLALCTDPDLPVDNPQRHLQCIMCKLKGELTVTGRLIPFQVNQFVHVNCALWSTDVHEIAEGGYLVNFFQVWTQRAKYTRCWHCNEPGASVFCFSTRHRCLAAYHFPCAYRNKKMSFAPRGSKETFCEACCKGHRGYHLGLPSEYANTKRRFQIAKNQQPWNMTHHMTSYHLQQLSLQAPQISTSNGSTAAADIEKPLQIEKWRPFYFDMFNRVGNLTVLSLRKETNQIIEEQCSTSKQAIPLNELNDFATVRIYWKYFTPKEEDIMNSIEQKPGKAFYLYSNNSLSEMAQNDLESLLPHVSIRVKEKVKLGLHYQSQEQSELALIKESRELIDSEQMPEKVFWQRLISHFQKERAKFSLQNIIFSISEFSGKSKYPVSIWNRASADGVKNKQFFLRSGEYMLQAQSNATQEKDSVTGDPSGNQVKIFGNAAATLSAPQGKIAAAGPALAPRGMATTIDDIFRRMTKINQMGEHQNPMASVKRVNASKHMQYEQVLHNLGKKMFYRAPPPAAIFEENANGAAKKSAATQPNAAAAALAKNAAKKMKQTDNLGSNTGGPSSNEAKESDLPIAMKYRMSKTQPKRVEVGPSKIHRNGLFTLEDLAAGDIVIEYVGERIRNKVADKREVDYEQKGIGDCYLFRLDKEYIIDATFHGNKARYLNHSCDANCNAKIISVQQHKHIIICTNRPVKSGEELTYNYNFDYEADKIECFCGAPGCLGRLN